MKLAMIPVEEASETIPLLMRKDLVNRCTRDSRINIGRIDLTTNCSFFEVPTEMAPTVLSKMKRVKVGDRKVVVDRADRTEEAPAPRRERKPARTFAEAADAGQLQKSGFIRSTRVVNFSLVV